MKTKKRGLSSRAGQKGRWLCSLLKSIWTGGKAFFSWNEKHRLIQVEALRNYLDPEERGSKFEYTPPKALPKPIPPVDPRSASADTDISREVGDNLLLPLNFRNN